MENGKNPLQGSIEKILVPMMVKNLGEFPSSAAADLDDAVAAAKSSFPLWKKTFVSATGFIFAKSS
ncbi:hypothetical protein RCO48_28355 [Peribacillus frigoritolerans]|nr:hypothetical protein [Peribacillus frigoritolerans]